MGSQSIVIVEGHAFEGFGAQEGHDHFEVSESPLRAALKMDREKQSRGSRGGGLRERAAAGWQGQRAARPERTCGGREAEPELRDSVAN